MAVGMRGRTRTTTPTAGMRRRPGHVLARSPWTVAALVTLLYCLWTAGYLLEGHAVLDMFHVGRRFALRSNASSVIVYPAVFTSAPSAGCGRQFCYYIALDALHAAPDIGGPG